MVHPPPPFLPVQRPRFSPDCTFHYEVMEHRRDARDFAKTLGRPSGTGLRAARSTRPRSAEGMASEGSLRWEPGRRVKPGLPEAARGTVRSPSPKGKGRTVADRWRFSRVFFRFVMVFLSNKVGCLGG